MNITMCAGSRLVFLCLCHFGMPIKVVILVPWPINAADNRAGMITISRDSASPRQRSAQREAEIDRATSLNRQARQCLDQGRYDEAEPLLKRALATREKALGAGHLDSAQSLNYEQEKYAESLHEYKVQHAG